MNEPFAQPNIFKAPQEERRASEYKCGRDLSGVWSRRSSESQASCLKPLSHCHHHDPPTIPTAVPTVIPPGSPPQSPLWSHHDPHHSPHCDPTTIPTTTSMSNMKISRRRMILSKSILLLVGGCRCQIHFFTQQTFTECLLFTKYWTGRWVWSQEPEWDARWEVGTSVALLPRG